MKNRLFSLVLVGCLALAAWPTQAQAQRWRGGFRVDTPGFSLDLGRGYPYYYRDYGYRDYGYRYYYDRPYYGRSYWYEPRSWYSPSYDRGYRSYYYEPAPTYAPTYAPRYAPSTASYDSRAQLRVVVPDPNARIWINDAEMQQRGRERHFITPPLRTDVTSSYTIVASWRDANGQEVRQERHVTVQPGQETVVSFT